MHKMSPTAKPLEKLEASAMTPMPPAAAAAVAEVEAEKPMIPQKQRYLIYLLYIHTHMNAAPCGKREGKERIDYARIQKEKNI